MFLAPRNFELVVWYYLKYLAISELPFASVLERPSLRAKPLLWTCVPPVGSFSCKYSFIFERFCTRARFEREARGNSEMHSLLRKEIFSGLGHRQLFSCRFSGHEVIDVTRKISLPNRCLEQDWIGPWLRQPDSERDKRGLLNFVQMESQQGSCVMLCC